MEAPILDADWQSRKRSFRAAALVAARDIIFFKFNV